MQTVEIDRSLNINYFFNFHIWGEFNSLLQVVVCILVARIPALDNVYKRQGKLIIQVSFDLFESHICVNKPTCNQVKQMTKVKFHFL